MNRILFLLAPFSGAVRDSIPVTIWERLSPGPQIVVAVAAPKIPEGIAGIVRFQRFPLTEDGSTYDNGNLLDGRAYVSIEAVGTWKQCHVYVGSTWIGSFLQEIDGEIDTKPPTIVVEEYRSK